VRGVIEGFYGTPWRHEERLALLEFLGAHKLNAYVYAPKDDAKHRAQWRELYTRDELTQFAELVAAGRAADVVVGYAIAPGLDIAYGKPDEQAALLAKLTPLLYLGCEWIVLALDDITLRAGLGAEHAALAEWLHGELAGFHGPRLSLVPTDYVGTARTPYLDELAAGLPAGIDLMWTGRTVCSPTITAAEARARAMVTGGRRPLVWDNFPVNDGAMSAALHLGPYEGRDPALADTVEGILLNPMTQPRASRVALATAAAYFTDPAGYDADAAWTSVLTDLGGPPLRDLAGACGSGPLRPPEHLALHRLVDDLEGELDGPGWCAPLAALAARLRTDRELEIPDPALRLEAAPWVQQLHREARAGMAAVRLLQCAHPIVQVAADGTGRAGPPDDTMSLLAAFSLQHVWAEARAGTEIVHGPRFTTYPAIALTPDGRPILDPVAGFVEDRNAVDRLARLALAAYQRQIDAGAPDLRLMADGHDVELAADGAFTLLQGARVVLARSGPLVTRATVPSDPPLSDHRLR
jgi:hyaluronoglucosaminidase